MNRRLEAELMDDPGVDSREHDEALRALNDVNGLLGVNRQLARAIERFGPLEQISVLDVGAGGGGFLAYLRDRARLEGRGRLVGLDFSPRAAERARRWHPDGIQFVVGDARRIGLADGSIDVATCSLLLHHFDEGDAAKILAEMARVARRGAVVGDLSRSTMAWALTWLTTRVLSRSRLFHIDGPRSVCAAFQKKSLLALARRAGLEGARVRRAFPFRLILTWSKASHGNGKG